MSNTYMPGETRRLYYAAESSHGVTPTSALVYAGLIESLQAKVNFKVETHPAPQGRGFAYKTRGAAEVGFLYRFKPQAVSGAYNWKNFWAVYGLGASTGIQDGTTSYGRLGSFSALVGRTQGATSYYNLYNGCKVNQAKITAEELGKALMFEAEIFAQYISKGTSKTFTGLQSVVVGADPTIITTNPLTWNNILTANIGGAGAANIYPKKWSLTINNNLGREPGTRVGADTNKYQLAALNLSEGKRDITFEMTLPQKDESWVNAKIDDSTITITIPIDTSTITLSGGVFAADDLPEMKQDLAEQTVKIYFNALSIA